MQRQKTKLEKLFSFNRYKKRFGASSVAPDISNSDYETLKNNIIEGEKIEQYESEAFGDLTKHMTHLRTSFQGQPEILFYHAKLIVMIRREYKVDQHFKAFCKLWQEQSDFLLKNLNLRWIISACDTFIDHSEDDTLKALCFAVVWQVNTLNMYESERHYWNTNQLDYTDYKGNKIPQGSLHLLLFDGLEGILPERGDTLRNMRWRMNNMAKLNPIGGAIMLEVFNRLNHRYSVYSRFKPLHKKDRTQWWG